MKTRTVCVQQHEERFISLWIIKMIVHTCLFHPNSWRQVKLLITTQKTVYFCACQEKTSANVWSVCVSWLQNRQQLLVLSALHLALITKCLWSFAGEAAVPTTEKTRAGRLRPWRLLLFGSVSPGTDPSLCCPTVHFPFMSCVSLLSSTLGSRPQSLSIIPASREELTGMKSGMKRFCLLLHEPTVTRSEVKKKKISNYMA